jgi:hypothetical protein
MERDGAVFKIQYDRLRKEKQLHDLFIRTLQKDLVSELNTIRAHQLKVLQKHEDAKAILDEAMAKMYELIKRK